jgi:integrase
MEPGARRSPASRSAPRTTGHRSAANAATPSRPRTSNKVIDGKRRRISFHDLRHAFGTAAISQLDGYKVQSYMGHQHYSTTQRYLHHKPQPEDARALERAFGGGAGKTDNPATPADLPTNGGGERHD